MVTNSQLQPESHWLIKIMLSSLLFMMCLMLGLKVWEIQQISSFPSIIEGNLGFLPSLVSSLQMGSTLLYKGLVINGILCLVLIGAGPQHTATIGFTQAVGCIALLWNCFLVWELSSITAISDPTVIMTLTHTLHIYPTAGALNELLINLGYLITWLALFFPLHDANARGQFHFHPDIFSFISLAHGLYGAYLALSIMSSTGVAPLLESHPWYQSLLWAKQFMFLASILFITIGGFYILLTLKTLSNKLDSLAFSHWFALVLGLTLLYAANPMSGLHHNLPLTAQYLVGAGLCILWFAHLYYCFISAKELQSSLKLNYIQFGYLIFTLIVFSIALLNFATEIVPREMNHETPFWITLSNEFILGGFLLLTFFLFSEFSQLISTHSKTQSKIVTPISYALIGLGFLIAMLAAGLSLYYQQKIELAAIHKGMSVDYHEMSDSLQPLLTAFATGIALLFVSTALLFLRSLYLFFWISTPQTQSVTSSPVVAQNETKNRIIIHPKERAHD